MTNPHGCHTVLPGSSTRIHVSAAHSITLFDPDVGSQYGVLGCVTVCVCMCICVWTLTMVRMIYFIQNNQMTYSTGAAMMSPLLILKECIWLIKMSHEYIRTSIIIIMTSLNSFRNKKTSLSLKQIWNQSLCILCSWFCTFPSLAQEMLMTIWFTHLKAGKDHLSSHMSTGFAE